MDLQQQLIAGDPENTCKIIIMMYIYIYIYVHSFIIVLFNKLLKKL